MNWICMTTISWMSSIMGQIYYPWYDKNYIVCFVFTLYITFVEKLLSSLPAERSIQSPQLVIFCWVYPSNFVWTITSSSFMGGFLNTLAQMFTMMRRRAACKTHVSRSKSQRSYVKYGYNRASPDHKFIIYGWILKYLGTNVHHDETVCHTQDPCL